MPIAPRPDLSKRPAPPEIDRAEIVVPRPGSMAARLIAAGSGVVALPFAADPDKVLVYYEGNLHDAMNLRKWPERVHIAFSRASTRYPTTARSLVPRDELETVGEFVKEGNLVLLDQPALVAQWTGLGEAGVMREVAEWGDEQAARRAAKEWRENRGQWSPGFPRVR
jgi:hypothetical protein